MSFKAVAAAIVFATGFVGTVGNSAVSRELSVELRAYEKANAPVASTVKLYGASHALIIGNDGYSGAWPRLSNAVRDAELVAKAMRAKGFDVTLKTDLKSAELIETLEKFFYQTGQDPDARLFLWYAGHGYSEAGEGYLVPVDAPDPGEGWKFLRKALSLRRMGEYVRGAKALHILSVFDSCFAGTVFNVGRAKPPPAITRATTRPVRQFLTSGDAGQEVSDDGTFRKLFLRAINGESRADANRDGYLAASELGLFMTSQITNYTDGNQTPRNGKLSDPDLDLGDFVFQVAARATARPAALGVKPTTPAPTGQSAEILFWQSIKDSKDAESYQAYLDTFPTGAFAALARVRLKAATGKRTASVAPRITLEPVESTFVALRNVNVRAAPDVGAAKVASLDKGSEVYVPGKVTAKDWLAVNQNGKRLGYVYSKLLQDKDTFIAEQAAEKQRRIEVARLAREAEVKREEMARKQAAAEKERLEQQRRATAARMRQEAIEREAINQRAQAAADAARLAQEVRDREVAKKREDEARQAEAARIAAAAKKAAPQKLAALTPSQSTSSEACTSQSLAVSAGTTIDIQKDCRAIMHAISDHYDNGGYLNDYTSNEGMKMEEFYLIETVDQTDNEVTVHAKYKIVANFDFSEHDYSSKFTLIKQGSRYKVTDMYD